jgi:hypothetical protein
LGVTEEILAAGSTVKLAEFPLENAVPLDVVPITDTA